MSNLQVKVLMMGGRRCGKTSVLAAMKQNFDEQCGKMGLIASYKDINTLDVLEEKREEINDYFRGSDNRTFSPDSNPTEDMTTYSMSIGLKDKIGGVDIEFTDFPGEWLSAKNGTGYREKLVGLMKETQVLIVAIDTPHLMEEEGDYNEKRNLCHKTSEMIKHALEDLKDESSYIKMVLFVPLKCERYLNDGKMDEVCKKTEEAYSSLISYLQQNKMKYEVAVTPIFTLGGAEFSYFERDGETKRILLNKEYKTPEKAIYSFPDMSVRKPSPKYCEQPLIYLLEYLMNLAAYNEWAKYQKETWMGKAIIKLNGWLFNVATMESFIDKRCDILDYLKKTGDGYHIIQDPMKF